MLTKSFRVMWVKVQINQKKNFYLNLPISFYAFEELLDCAMDWLEIGCFFTTKKMPANPTSVSIHSVKALLQAVISLLDSLAGTEPYDLVDVEANNVKIVIRIR